MSTARNLKNLTGQIRRTETALRNLVSLLDLSDSDRRTLLSAATILNLNGEKVSSAAKKAKRAEEVEEKARAKARVIAKELVKAWPTESVLDKVAICSLSYQEANLRRDLQEKKCNWKKNLDYWTGDALRDLTENVAYQSVRQSKPINELMSAEKEKLEAVKAHSRIIALAERWQANIAAEQTENST